MSLTLILSLRQRLLGLCLLATLILLTACTVPTATTGSSDVEATAAPSAETAVADSLFPLTITDAAGQEFTFDAPPRIGCWWAGCTEILADLGLVAHAAGYDEETAKSIFAYPQGLPPQQIADTQNPELWAAAEVDIVIMRVPVAPEHDAYKLATPVFYLHHPSYGESAQSGYDAFLENLRIVGQLTGKPEAAAAAIARFTTDLDTLRSLSTPEIAAQTVAVLFQGDGYRMIGPGNPFCVALAEAELGTCIGEGAASYEVNAEEFLGLDPDWIVYQTGDTSYQDRADPIWAELSAVKAGQVYDATNNRYYCCSTRGLILALQDYANHVLPAGTVPATGPQGEFDPTQSPLVAATTVTTAGVAPRTYTEAFGREVALPAAPQRIIALYYASEMVTLGRPMIGTTVVNAELTLTPEQLQGIEDVGGFEPNLEKIFSLKPDLILAPDFMEPGTIDQLAQIAPTVVIPYSGDPLVRLQLLGDLVGKPEVARAWLAAYAAKAALKREAVAPFIAPGESAVAFIMYGDQNLYVYGRPRLGPTLYDVFGFTQPPAVAELFSANPDELWQTISPELLPQLAGDRIFLVQAGDEAAQAATATLIEGPIWQNLPAVQNGKVYYVDARWALNDPLTLDWLLDEVAALLVQ